MALALQALPGRLYTDEFDLHIVNKRVEDPHRVRPAAYARDDRGGEAPRLLQHLGPRLAADDRLELPHHPRIWRGPDDRTNDVVAVIHIRYPIPDRLARRILQRSRPGCD